jgi:abortive infection bacteriophage resistance protein
MKWISQFLIWLKGKLGLIPAVPAFTKPALTYDQQIHLLRSRGLLVADEPMARRCLTHHNYYRLSAYRFPLSEPTDSHQFLPGTTFEQLWGLYCFDGALRLLVTEAVKRVELSTRSRFAYEFGHAYGAHSYADATHFRNPKKHAATLKKIDAEISRSKEDFILHFRNTHGLTRPPIWAACEVMSFGNVSFLYSIIGLDRDKKRIASTYGLSISDFGSLLHHIAYIRNICAHHARLWNRRFTITVELPKKKPAALIPSLHPTERQRIYNSLVLLSHMMNTIQPDSRWASRVRQLIEAQTFPVTQHMGFPSDWQSRPIWQP